MQPHIVVPLRSSIQNRVHGILSAFVLVVSAAFLAASRPALADSSLINTPQPIVGGIEVRLIFTDADGKRQDYSLTSVPPAVFSALTPRLQAESKLPILRPDFFLGGWSEIASSVCQDVLGQVKQTINSSANQAYDFSCVPMKVGIMHAQIQTSWETDTVALRGQPASPGGFAMASGRRLVLSYYVPPFNRAHFTVTSPDTCQKSKAWWGCAANPTFTMLYDVALQLIATSSDPNSFTLPLKAVPSDSVGMQAMLGGAAYDKKIDAAAAAFERDLAVDAGTAIVDWYGALIAAVVQAIKELITNAGALVASAANVHLRDYVSFKLSNLASAAAGRGVTQSDNAFNLLFASLESANGLGFTQLDIDTGPKHSLQFRLTYPPPAKPGLSNTVVADNKGIHLSPASIGTGVQQVKPGDPFLVHGNNFALPFTNALNISWGHTVAGVGKTQMQWGPKGGQMQDTNVVVDNFRAPDLQPGTTYQFRVHECDAITCAPWSDWFTTTTEGSGSNKVAIWLDSDSGHSIGNGVVLPDGSFVTKVIIQAGTASGSHTLHAATGAGAPAVDRAVLAPSFTSKNPASVGTRATAESPQASVDITVCGPSGCGPSISVMNSETKSAMKPPVTLLYPSAQTLRGDQFAPGSIVTLHLDSASGPKLGTATPNKLGIFEANFQIPFTQTGNHKLVAVQDAPGGSLKAAVDVNLISQPK